MHKLLLKKLQTNTCSIIKSQKGQGLLEVLAALTIAMIVLTALSVASINSVRNATFSKNQTIANAYARQAMESVRAYRDINPSTFFSSKGTSGGTCYYINQSLFTSNPTADWLLPNASGDTAPCTNITTQVDPNENLANGFIRKIMIDNSATSTCPSAAGASAGSKCATVVVYVFWQDASGSHSSTLTSYYSNFEATN